MKLLFIYGAPGVGKLTVANEIEKLTGYKNFHNQLTIDMLGPIFEWGSRPFIELINKIREDIIETAAREGTPGIIFTFVYDGDEGSWVKKIVGLVEKHQGEVCFIQLIASKEALLERVANASRHRYRKIKDPKKLEKLMNEHDFSHTVEHGNHISIDNTKKSPSEVANMIIDYFKLKD